MTSRRSQRPATDGIPEDERELITDEAGEPRGTDAEHADGDGDTAAPKPSPGAGSDAWWQEQRPPHWS